MNLSSWIKKIYQNRSELKKEPISGLLITDHQLALNDNFTFLNLYIANNIQKQETIFDDHLLKNNSNIVKKSIHQTCLLPLKASSCKKLTQKPSFLRDIKKKQKLKTKKKITSHIEKIEENVCPKIQNLIFNPFQSSKKNNFKTYEKRKCSIRALTQTSHRQKMFFPSKKKQIQGIIKTKSFGSVSKQIEKKSRQLIKRIQKNQGKDMIKISFQRLEDRMRSKSAINYSDRTDKCQNQQIKRIRKFSISPWDTMI